MTIKEILTGGGVGLVLLLSLVQISPIKINPWTFIARAIGKAINGEVIAETKATKRILEEHIAIDNERAADGNRQRILRFNDEVMRQIPHTEEHYIEVLKDIDDYEAYCREHTDYKNSRAVFAIENIKRVYAKRLEKNDFLK